MKRRQRMRLTVICVLLTGCWLALGTLSFVRWQSAEAPGAPARTLVWPALEAATICALIFWVVAGIAYGLVRWIATGRGPQA